MRMKAPEAKPKGPESESGGEIARAAKLRSNLWYGEEIAGTAKPKAPESDEKSLYGMENLE